MSQGKNILITSIVYFNYDLVKTHVDFLAGVSNKADVIILENPSDSTPQISKHCVDLVQQNKISKYLLFDQNIGMNTFETLFNTPVVNIDNYSYVIITDGDLTVNNNPNWLEEQTYILDRYSDTYACGVKMSLENLPSPRLYPDVNKWYPHSSKITNDYEDGETGLHLLMYKTDVLKKFLNFMREHGLTLMDTTMHVFCNSHLKKQWRRTKNSVCYHHTWDLYKNANDEYTKIKTTKSRDEMWFHNRFCDYTVYEPGGLDLAPRFSKQSKHIRPLPVKSHIKPLRQNKIKKSSLIPMANSRRNREKIVTIKKETSILDTNTKVLGQRKIVNRNRPSVHKVLTNNTTSIQTKLNIGCGDKYFDNGWLNVDLLRSPVVPKGIQYLSMNVLNSFPFRDIELIYSEHFIEHLTKVEGISFIRNSFEALRSGGVLRIATFDLDILIDTCHSTNKDWKTDYCVNELGLGHVMTRAELLNISFNAWGHKYVYNGEELEDVFRKGGFTNIKFCKIYDSSHPELRNRETRINSTLIIEGTK